MKLSTRKIGVLFIACAFLVLITSNLVHAAETDYISRLSISMLDPPDSVTVGETFTVKVNVVNNSNSKVTGRLRVYLYASTDEVSYPPPEEGFTWVPLTEGGWESEWEGGNERRVTIRAGENKTYEFTLTLLEEIRFTSGTAAQARLRARIRKTDVNVLIARDHTMEGVIVRQETKIWSLELPLIIKIILAAVGITVVIGGVAYLALSGGEEVETTPAPSWQCWLNSLSKGKCF